MAYNSNINYAEDLDYLLRTGAVSPTTVNRYLNERMEKQQAAGENVYDDTYRRAMAYLLASGQDLMASDNVDYASAANNVLASDAAQEDYYQNLAAVLAQREAKLGSGGYGDYQDAGIDDGAGGEIAYNGPGSLYETVANYLMGEKLAAASYPYLSGGYVNPGITQEGLDQSARETAVELIRAGYPASYLQQLGYGTRLDADVVAASGLSKEELERLGYGDYTTTPGKGSAAVTSYGSTGYSGYSPSEINSLRRAARENVGVTNAATRAPVQGEDSSYVEASTKNAYRDSLAALRESGDSQGAAALSADQENYGRTGHVGKVAMPELAETGLGAVTGASSGSASGTARQTAAGTQEAETPTGSSSQLSNVAYNPVGYEKWLSEIFSPASPGAVYDSESRRRGAGDLYEEAAELISGSGGGRSQTETPSYQKVPRRDVTMVSFDDNFADIPYEQMRSTYVTGYGPASDDEIQAMYSMGKLKARYDGNGRQSYYYDKTPKYRRTETVR